MNANSRSMKKQWVRTCLIAAALLCACLTGCNQQADQRPVPSHPAANTTPPTPINRPSIADATRIPAVNDIYTSQAAPKKEKPQPNKQTATMNKQSNQISATNRSSSGQMTGKKQQLSLSQLIQKYPTNFIRIGTNKLKKVALTFDDAPDDKFTPQVLDVLKKHHIKATFFIVGERAKKHPDIMKRIVREGHAIGNHSLNHSLFTRLSLAKFQTQIADTQLIIKSFTGYTPKYMRPPYGELNEEQLKWLIGQGITAVFWSVDSQDWRQKSAKQVEANIMNSITSGAIVLQHSGGGVGQDLSGTVNALPTVITRLKKAGYDLVTIPDLLN